MSNKERVLVINDVPQLSQRLTRWLRRRKVVFSLVDTDDEARERMDKERYDLVFYGSEFLNSAKLQSGW